MWPSSRLAWAGALDADQRPQPRAFSHYPRLSYDHTYLLGNTLAEIAAEKGGIIKRGARGQRASRPEALAVLERLAVERHAPLTLAGRGLAIPSAVARPGRPGIRSMVKRGEQESPRITCGRGAIPCSGGRHSCASRCWAGTRSKTLSWPMRRLHVSAG